MRALRALGGCAVAALLSSCDDAPATSATSSSSTGRAVACGSRSGMRGLTHRSVTVGGKERTFEVYLPEAIPPTAPIAFVSVHHGYLQSGEEMRVLTRYTELADKEGFALVFPDGEAGPNTFGPPWNIGDDVCPSATGITPVGDGDDFGLLDAMKASVAPDQCLDEAHVFVTGFSMGGYFSHHAACLRDDVRSAAPHSGGTAHDLAACTTGHKPMIIFHGDADPLIPAGCDDPGATNTPDGFTPSAAAWAARNGCAATSTVIPIKNGECLLYDGCPPDGQVELCRFKGMEHCWAGGDPNVGSDACPDYERATELTWAFWKKYAW
ncbi:MAG: PHB depolymerase family esterase [Polyangiaceae bacterium]